MRSRSTVATPCSLTVRTAAPALLLAGGLAACVSDRPSTGPERPQNGPEVAIENFAYVPPSLTVASGTTVIWTNADDAPHTVTADDGESFESGILDERGVFELTVPPPGTYGYHCAVHPFMTGTLTVRQRRRASWTAPPTWTTDGRCRPVSSSSTSSIASR